MSEYAQSKIAGPLPDSFFSTRGNTRGSKGLMKLSSGLYLFYRRDFNTDKYPGTIDLIGGGALKNETGFEVLCRETAEEISVLLRRHTVSYAREYPSKIVPSKVTWFAHLDLGINLKDLKLGDEGLDLISMSLDDYLLLSPKDVFPFFQDRTRDYLEAP